MMAHLGLSEEGPLVQFLADAPLRNAPPARRERASCVYRSLPFRSEGQGTPACCMTRHTRTAENLDLDKEEAAVRRCIEDCNDRLDGCAASDNSLFKEAA